MEKDYNLGFEPVFDKYSEILILGSFPSVISRKNNFYYGNKRNRFWKMLENIFNDKIGDSIEDKKAFLIKHNIALWDVLSCCNIKGSSDKNINLDNSMPNDLNIILDSATNINKIICNGKKSYELFKIHFKNCPIKVICLPSTSPANVRFNIEMWQKELKNN